MGCWCLERGPHQPSLPQKRSLMLTAPRVTGNSAPAGAPALRSLSHHLPNPAQPCPTAYLAASSRGYHSLGAYGALGPGQWVEAKPQPCSSPSALGSAPETKPLPILLATWALSTLSELHLHISGTRSRECRHSHAGPGLPCWGPSLALPGSQGCHGPTLRWWSAWAVVGRPCLPLPTLPAALAPWLPATFSG